MLVTTIKSWQDIQTIIIFADIVPIGLKSTYTLY